MKNIFRFEKVQKEGLFKDAKTFVDATPKSDPRLILEAFDTNKDNDAFDLKSFVTTHFSLPQEAEEAIPKASNMKDYIWKMWTVLLKEMKATSPYSSSHSPTLILFPEVDSANASIGIVISQPWDS